MEEKENVSKAEAAALLAKLEAEARERAKREQAQGAPAAPSAAPAAPIADALAAQKAGEPVRQYSNLEEKLRRKYKLEKDPVLHDNTAVPGFVIAKGEKVIRSYRCLSTRKGDGILCLTNRRLLVNAGERSEIPVEKITSIRFNQYRPFTVLRFLVSLIILGLGVFLNLLTGYVEDWIPNLAASWSSTLDILCWTVGSVCCLIGFLALWVMFTKQFYFYIFSREDKAFFESKSKRYAKEEKKGKVFRFRISKAGKDTEKAARELGALIIEAKEGRYED